MKIGIFVVPKDGRKPYFVHATTDPAKPDPSTTEALREIIKMIKAYEKGKFLDISDKLE